MPNDELILVRRVRTPIMDSGIQMPAVEQFLVIRDRSQLRPGDYCTTVSVPAECWRQVT